MLIPSDSETAVDVDGLVKRYRGVRAVDGLTLRVPTGTVVALLGPNGAGKTTTVECIEGFRTADEGRVRVFGRDPQRERSAIAERIGVMLQEGGAYQAATPREMLALYARLYANPAPVDELVERLELGSVAGRRFRTLSGGQKQRLNLALALVGRPDLLILDEPTAGMDPQARNRTWELLRDHRDRGVAILLTTHLLDEAERLADVVAVVDRGRLVAHDSPAALVAGAGGRVIVTTTADVAVDELSAAVGAPVRREAAGRYVVVASTDVIPRVTGWFVQHGLPLTGVTSEGGLEDVYLRLVDDPERG